MVRPFFYWLEIWICPFRFLIVAIGGALDSLAKMFQILLPVSRVAIVRINFIHPYAITLGVAHVESLPTFLAHLCELHEVFLHY